MSTNVWAVVAGVTGYLPMSALTGATGQLLGMNAGATLAEWKAATFLNNQLAVPVGAVGAPSYVFTGSLTTGFYSPAADQLALSVSGVQKLLVSVLASGVTNFAFTGNIQAINGLIEEAQSVDIAAVNGVTDLAGATGNYVYITNNAGIKQITGLGGAVIPKGVCIECKFVIIGGSVTLVNDAVALQLPGGVNLAVNNGDIIRFRKTNSAAAYWEVASRTVSSSLQITTSAERLVEFIHADAKLGHRDLIYKGWLPWGFNQQWGGSPHYYELVDEATGTPYRFEAATGYIEDDGNALDVVANIAANTWRSQGFKVSKSDNYSAVWVKIRKSGNPGNNLEMRILPDDGTGKPLGAAPIANGTATAQIGKLHTLDIFGQWVRFVFPVAFALVAGTQYHITLKSSGAVDPANFWVWNCIGSTATARYPFGNVGVADATPTWTAALTFDACFLVETPSTSVSFQTGGAFGDGKLTFFEGTPLVQSNGRCKNLKDFVDFTPSDFTLHLSGTGFTKDKTIVDICYGIDHDRIVVRADAGTGFLRVIVYRTDGSSLSLAGVTDLSTAGDKTIGIRVRAKGDGADTVLGYVNAALEINSTNQTLTFDELFAQAEIGTFWLGGGFPVAPAWTQDVGMTALPSTVGWTWTTTTASVEATCMSINNNQMYQNKAGYAAGGDGGYVKAALALSNAAGWATALKMRVVNNTNTRQGAATYLSIEDGTRFAQLFLQEYFSESFASSDHTVMVDNKIAETVIFFVGKGTDAFIFQNGRLTDDMSTSNTTGTANNQIKFGDFVVTANENADALYDYFKYYNTAWQPPQFTAASLYEFALWSGDRTALLPSLYSSGTLFSVKQVCGIQQNFVGGEIVQRYRQAGVTGSPTSASTQPTQLPEMETFAIGSRIESSHYSRFGHSVDTNWGALAEALDGNAGYGGITAPRQSLMTVSGAGGIGALTIPKAQFLLPFGLHKIETKMAASAATATFTNTMRGLDVEARA